MKIIIIMIMASENITLPHIESPDQARFQGGKGAAAPTVELTEGACPYRDISVLGIML